MPNKVFFTKWSDFFMILFFAAFWLLLSVVGFNVLNEDFLILDDHCLVQIEKDLELTGYVETISKYLEKEKHTRLRPVFWTNWVSLTYIFGANFKFLKITYLIFFIVTSFFLYKSAFLFTKEHFASLIFALVVLLGPQTISMWTSGAAEINGILYFSLGFYFFLKGSFDKVNLTLLGVFFLILAMLSKETFMPLFLFVILFSLSFELKKGGQSLTQILKKNLFHYCAIAIVGVILLYIVSSKSAGYAGVDRVGLIDYIEKSLKPLRQVFSLPIKYLLLSTVIILGLKFCFRVFNEKVNKVIIGLLFIVSLSAISSIFFPQIILHIKSGFYSRYYLPISLSFGFLYLLAYELWPVRIFNKFYLKHVLILITIPILIATTSYKVYPLKKWVYNAGKNNQKLLDIIRKNPELNQKILIISDPAYEFESILSLHRFLTMRYNYENVFVLNLTEGKNYPKHNLALRENIKHGFDIDFIDKTEINNYNFSSVIVVPDRKNDYDFKKVFKDNYFDINKFSYRKVGNFEIFNSDKKKNKLIDSFSELKQAKRSTEGCKYWISRINGKSVQKDQDGNTSFIVTKDDSLTIEGWAYNSIRDTLLKSVYVKIGDNLYKSNYGLPNKYLYGEINDNPQLALCGFSLKIDDLSNFNKVNSLQCMGLSFDNSLSTNLSPLISGGKLFLKFDEK